MKFLLIADPSFQDGSLLSGSAIHNTVLPLTLPTSNAVLSDPTYVGASVMVTQMESASRPQVGLTSSGVKFYKSLSGSNTPAYWPNRKLCELPCLALPCLALPCLALPCLALPQLQRPAMDKPSGLVGHFVSYK
jgi:hypothetical protein